ncbi:MAG: terpene cyclase/mutase family protein [Opitutae bacterium]|nr:terpene cyclase/mutase family protein [Opitutae bacterium]
MQRQKKAKPTVKTTFRATTISDIAMPDLNEIDVKELAAVVDVASPETGEVSMNNDAMKSALKGIGLNLPKTMENRCDPKKRVARLRSGGGKDITETAIILGLNWLKNTQAADGSWGGDAKGEEGVKSPQDKNAMTAMALLSFLGHCELQDSPEFGPTVQKAINFLTSTPPDKMTSKGCYSHPIRTYALCEAYTMTKIKKLELFAKRASEFVINGQNENGGWAYGYGKGVAAHTDLSVAGWNIQALKAAAYTGISIDGLDEAMDKAVEYTKKCQDEKGKFQYRMSGHGGQSGQGSLTGTGVLCLQIWKNAKSQEAQKGLEWIIANQATEWKGVNVYAWYYHAQACFQATGVSGGTKYWRAWNKNFQQIVCSAQESDGHWPHGAHYHGDSDIYRTTMTILMLEVYYRYMPTGKTG